MISDQQKAALRLITKGASDEEIGAQLLLDREAVGQLVEQLFPRFGVSSRVELILLAYSETGSRLLEGGQAA